MKLLKYENAKLKRQLIFSIPAGKAICGMECPGCYAMKFQRIYPTVLPARERWYQASLTDDFVPTIISDIQACKKPVDAIRIHESGEFYSQAYLDKWTTIAQSLPNHRFYAFTKRIKDFDFSLAKSLPNFVIIDSLMSGSLNYSKAPTGKVCPATDGTSKTCDSACGYCWTKQAQSKGISFVKH